MAPVMVSWGSRAGRSARLCGANSADGMRAGLALCRCRDMASARSVADRFGSKILQRLGRGKTLREVAATRVAIESMELVGTPETVAAQMGEAMEYVGGDGFLVASPVTRKNITEIADALAPVLRRRGLTRSSYSHEYFRDNLLEF